MLITAYLGTGLLYYAAVNKLLLVGQLIQVGQVDGHWKPRVTVVPPIQILTMVNVA